MPQLPYGLGNEKMRNMLVLSVISRFVDSSFPCRWDWIAGTISSIAIIIAFFTLISQRKTEKNTVRYISPKVQFELLVMAGEELFRLIALSNALKVTVLLTKKQMVEFCTANPLEDNKMISEMEATSFKFPIPPFPELFSLPMEDYFIHGELFYCNPDAYREIRNLQQDFSDYDAFIQSFLSSLNEGISVASCDLIIRRLDELSGHYFDVINKVREIELSKSWYEKLFQKRHENLDSMIMSYKLGRVKVEDALASQIERIVKDWANEVSDNSITSEHRYMNLSSPFVDNVFSDKNAIKYFGYINLGTEYYLQRFFAE